MSMAPLVVEAHNGVLHIEFIQDAMHCRQDRFPELHPDDALQLDLASSFLVRRNGYLHIAGLQCPGYGRLFEFQHKDS